MKVKTREQIIFGVRNGYVGGGREGLKVKTRQTDTIQFGDEELDLSAVEQIFDKSQTRAIGDALQLIRYHQHRKPPRPDTYTREVKGEGVFNVSVWDQFDPSGDFYPSWKQSSFSFPGICPGTLNSTPH